MDKNVAIHVKNLGEYMSKYIHDTFVLCVETVEDCVYVEQRMANRDPFFAVVALRVYKLENRSYPYEQFEGEYVADQLMALKKLFLHPVSMSDVRMVRECMDRGMPLRYLYDLHVASPTKQLLRLLHKCRVWR